MELSDLIAQLREKPVLGEYGAFNRPYVILDIDEYQALLQALEKRQRARRVPKQTTRTEATP